MVILNILHYYLLLKKHFNPSLTGGGDFLKDLGHFDQFNTGGAQVPPDQPRNSQTLVRLGFLEYATI